MRAFYLLLALLAGCSEPGFTAQLPVSAPVKAVLGEAEGEGYQGMLAVACAIRNRGTLRGVYGLQAHRTYSSRTIALAEKAWAASAHVDVTNGATGWGNASDLVEFKKHSWWRHCKITAHIGHHWFYRRTT